ncbi:MAG TPA: hypothetical protein VKM93_14135 [Terriglobia bacterium]|nr:hypothetical protein [Terriglobia bacterium]
MSSRQSGRYDGDRSRRIPDDRFRGNFGRDHTFRIDRNYVVAGGYSRFQYGGFWFGMYDPWPVGWSYNDDVYVDYAGDGYYLYSPMHPGIQISLGVELGADPQGGAYAYATWSPQHGRYGYRGGRIRDDRFRSHFGREHMFRINRAYRAGGYSGFRYGGVRFAMYDPWPEGWNDTDDVYVDYADGGYYLYSPTHPDDRLALRVVS